MNITDTIKLMKKYSVCPTCGNEYVGNGAGALVVDEDVFYRSCPCGWEICVNGAGENIPVPKNIDVLKKRK